jgi:hypothetical protein
VPWRHPARNAIYVAGLTDLGVVMHETIIIDLQQLCPKLYVYLTLSD